MYYFCAWRGGRVVDCGGLENRWAARLRGFESLPLRKTTKQKGIEKSIPFVFYTLSQACLQTRCEKQRERLATFCAVGLQGPLRRAEGKGVKRSDHRERSSQFLPLLKKIKNIILCFYASTRASMQQKIRIRRTNLAYFSYLCINNSNGGARRYHTISWLRLYTLHQYR